MRDAKNSKRYAGVVLDESVDLILDYEIPSELISKAVLGSRVIVPVKSSFRKGTIWALKEKPDFSTVKPILEIASEDSVLTHDLIALAKWISSYYITPMHKVLKTLLPSSIRNHMKEQNMLVVTMKASHEIVYETCEKLKKSHPKQALLLHLLQEAGGQMALSKLLLLAKASKSSLLSLEKKSLVSCSLQIKDRAPSFDADYFLSKAKTLSREQAESLDKIKESLQKNTFSTHLLYGITGSGKTEVYLQAIEEALLQDKGVIFLVPEISLTSQTIERLKSRFEEKLVLLHSKLSEGELRDGWHQIFFRKARIVIGARSAIFSPVPNLGLIIVDEEHDTAYKQTGEAPYYQARDVAVFRAKLCNATAILGSATPSLESYQNALDKKYVLHTLSSRHGSATLPKVEIVDMKHECVKKKGMTLFSDKLLTGIKQRLKSGEQTLLLLNRRGFHTSQICLKCAKITLCPHCETALTFHLGENILACHLCDYRIPPSNNCSSCQSPSSLKFKGAGTELVEKQLSHIFPESRILRMDKDTTQRKGSHDTIFKQFRSGKADILVGTQMIAKGLHFPSVTLVGVLNADLTLSIPDFRASESMFQLITQVAGRSGRGDLPGSVIVQTFLPDQTTLRHAADQNYLSFFKEETEIRKLFDNPPFIHLIKISLSGPSKEETEKAASFARHFLLEKLPSSFHFLPVVAAGHVKKRDLYHFQFLIKSQKILSASPLFFSLQNLFKNKDIQLFIDVDPSSTFF